MGMALPSTGDIRTLPPSIPPGLHRLDGLLGLRRWRWCRCRDLLLLLRRLLLHGLGRWLGLLLDDLHGRKLGFPSAQASARPYRPARAQGLAS